MHVFGAARTPRRPLRVVVALAFLLAAAGLALPASASPLPPSPADPGQTAAYQKLYAVTRDAVTRKVLPQSALKAVQRIGIGSAPAGAAYNTAARQAFWTLISTDLGQTPDNVVASMQSGKSVKSLATSNKQWVTLRTDVRAWVIHELYLELFPSSPHPIKMTYKKYLVIRKRLYAVTDTVLTVKVPKPKVKPTPSPKPTKTPKPTPTPTTKTTPTPKPRKTPKGAFQGA